MKYLICVTVLAAIGLYGPGHAKADDAEDRAAEAIVKLGGRVQGKPVVMVDFFGTKLTDAGLKEIAQLKSLTTLSVYDVTDKDLKQIGQLRQESRKLHRYRS